MMNNNYAPVPAGDNYKEITEGYKWIADSTAKLKIVCQDGSTATGTGFHVGNGCFLTAGHCCRSASNSPLDLECSLVEFSNKNVYHIEQVIINGLIDNLDFALLKLVSCQQPKVSCQEPKVNLCFTDELNSEKTVVIAHHPEGQPIKLSEGITTVMDFGDGLASTGSSGINMYEDEKRYFRYTPTTMPGSSGAPVGLNEEGVVLGVHVRGDGTTQDFHAATKVSAINLYCQQKTKKSLGQLICNPSAAQAMKNLGINAQSRRRSSNNPSEPLPANNSANSGNCLGCVFL